MEGNDVERLLAEYDESRPLYDAAASALVRLIDELLRSTGIWASVAGRVKDRAGLEHKLRSRVGAYSSLKDVTDLIGIRVVTYFADQVDLVSEVVLREFHVDAEKSVDKRTAPDQFGYLAVHYAARLKPERGALPEYRRWADLGFEVQIRSVLQQAWGDIEHGLGYRTETAVPRRIRRRFSQVAGLLEIADELFVTIRQDLEHYANEVRAGLTGDLAQVSVDTDSLAAYIQSSPLVLSVDEAIAAAAGAVRGEPDAARRTAGLISAVASPLGFATLADVDAWLRRGQDFVVAFGRNWLGPRRGAPLLPGACVVYVFCVRAITQSEAAAFQEFVAAVLDLPFEDAADSAYRIAKAFEATAAEVPLPPPPE